MALHPLRAALATALALAAAGCSQPGATPASPAADASPAAPAALVAHLQTQPTATAETNSAAVVLADDPAASRIIATAALGGLELYDLAGQRLASVPAGEAVAVDVGYGMDINGQRRTVVAAVESTHNSLRLFTLDGDTLADAGARPLPMGFAVEGLCLYRNPHDDALYAFVVGDGGEVDQQLVFANAEGKLDARQVRRIHLPSTAKQCVADREGQVYVSEEAVGIWRFNANPEADVGAVLVDSPRLGRLDEEVGGVALHDGGEGSRWLIASDASAGRLNVYDREDDERFLGSFTIGAAEGGETIGEPGPLSANPMPLGAGFPNGLLLVADEDGGNHKLVSIADIAAALGQPAGTPQDPRQPAAAPVPVVTPVHETAPTHSYGDAADDPAIWAHPTDPARSLVVATDKKAGLYLYDLQGKELQFLVDGKMNNVDLRDGFMLGGQAITLVTASDRTRKAIAIYRLDTAARQLVEIADGVQPTGLEDPYGLCMYRSARSGKTFVFINSGEGPLNQWELVDAGNGRVKANLVRELAFDSQTEGCVADDANGTLFIGEEDVGLWKLDAEPEGGSEKTLVQRISDNPALKDDFEGVGLYDLGQGRGYLVVSSQGNDTYAVFRRQAPHDYLGSFAVAGDGARGIDGISETDGLDVSSAPLGPGLETGAMVAQDGRNLLPVENQNYKVVSWSAIALALGLEQRGD